jgi:radical SAM protein with 4Fe4S-binding SPASM domain
MTVRSWETGQSVSVWIKPTERCQLRCAHCFVNQEFLRSSTRWDLETFERIVRRFQAYFAGRPVPGRSMHFIFHGGEPMIMGPAFYRQAIPLARRLLDDVGVSLQVSMQSNLLLLNDEWIEVLHEHFSHGIGTSFDWGLRDVGGSWETFRDRWLARYWQCREAKVTVGAITVVNRACVDIPDEVYDFFNELGCSFETYPMAPWGEENGKTNIGKFGITAAEYGRWLLRVWERYRDDPRPRTWPVFLYRLARAVAFGEPVGNHMAGDCAAGNLVVSTDGTVSYCPALAGSREHLYGNLLETDLATLLKSPTRMAVFRRQLLLPEDCRSCRWNAICHGGCPADALGFRGDAMKKDPYCEAYLMIFPQIASDLEKHRAPMILRNALQSAEPITHLFMQEA